MQSKKELRAARKAERKENKNRAAERLKASFVDDKEKTAIIPFNVVADKSPKGVEHRADILEKRPVFNISPSVYQSPMTWCAQIADVDGDWSWNEPRQWSDDEWNSELQVKLDSLEGKKWSEISAMNTGEGKKGSRRKLHHSQEVSSLHPDAQQRWLDLNLETFETAYRFRLGGKKRAWGFQLGGHFHMVWYERYHLIYPSSS